ncbi:MAG: M20/M25/M40 family metallo-hydrolase [Ardenticatenaceae bacterium]|nr:M20/M25/M40 family metallo-hydrolase [Ardenticatenaceae bacterium]
MIDQARLVQRFLDLVAIPSPSSQEQAIGAELIKRFAALGGQVAQDEHGNIVAHWPDGQGDWLLLSAHMDTHAHDTPIRPQIRNGVIYSDGTTILGSDDKSGVAVILETLQSLCEDGFPHPPVEVVISVGEERGLVGAHLLDTGALRARQGYVVDGDGPTGGIEIGTPTLDSIDVVIRGRKAHASKEPEKGISAIRVAAEAIAAMPLGRVDFETIGNIGVIQGGSAPNMIPDEVHIRGQARSHNHAKLERQVAAMVRAFEETAGRHGAQVGIKVTRHELSYRLTEATPVVAHATEAARRLGIEPRLDGNATATDANVFNQVGITCAVLATGVEDKHTLREHIAIDDLVNAARLLAEILATL